MFRRVRNLKEYRAITRSTHFRFNFGPFNVWQICLKHIEAETKWVLWDHNFVTAKQVIVLNLYDIYLMEIRTEIIAIWWRHHDLMRIKGTYVTFTSISLDLIRCDVGYNFCKTVWPQPTFLANLWSLYTPIASHQNLSQKFHNSE